MNVCYFNDSFPPLYDGVATTVENYARIFSEIYGGAAVLTPYYSDADDSRFPYPVIRCPSFRSAVFREYRVGNPLSVRAAKAVECFQPDIIHCHTPAATLALGIRLKRRLGVPLILTYHTKYDIEVGRIVSVPFLRRPLLRAMLWGINQCDEVWCVCRGAEENLRALGYRGKTILMTNGADFPKGPADKSKVDALRAELNLPENVPVFLFVGRLIWYKGLDTILSALAGLKGQGRDFRMLFVGDGQDFKAVQTRAEDLGIRDECVFTGAVLDRERLRVFYSAADLFLLPSAYDNCPVTVREALACGCPSVLLKDSSASDGFTDGETAFFVEDSADSLCTKLLEIAYDQDLLRRVGTAAMDQLWFSWDDAVKAAYERYQIAAGNRKNTF